MFGVSGRFASPRAIPRRPPIGVADPAGGLVRAAQPRRQDRIFNWPGPTPAGPSNRTFHRVIATGKQTRELGFNDPFVAPEIARLIRLTRYALCDPKVLSPKMLNDVRFAALQASSQAARERHSR